MFGTSKGHGCALSCHSLVSLSVEVLGFSMKMITELRRLNPESVLWEPKFHWVVNLKDVGIAGCCRETFFSSKQS